LEKRPEGQEMALLARSDGRLGSVEAARADIEEQKGERHRRLVG
jgi:hypothetical protein